MVYLVNDFTLDDVYSVGSMESREKVTDVNGSCGSSSICFRRANDLQGRRGLGVDGFLVKPLGWKRERSIDDPEHHGGPAGHTASTGTMSSSRRGKGYAVFFPSTGSTGYGQNSSGNRNQWGGTTKSM